MLVTNITVLVVDAHAHIRAAVNRALTSQPAIKLVVTAQDYTEAEKQTAQLLPDIIFLEMNIGRSDGIAEIHRLKKLSPASRIMAIADEEDEQEAFAAIIAGAQGYRSTQDIDPDEILSRIQMLCRDEFVLRPRLLIRLMQRLRAVVLGGSENASGSRRLQFGKEFNELAQLTAREREILQLISKGYCDRDIAKRLHISEKTVQKHVSLPVALDVHEGGEIRAPTRRSAFWLKLVSIFSLFSRNDK